MKNIVLLGLLILSNFIYGQHKASWVRTDDATNIKTTRAILNGYASPEGETFIYIMFQVGISSNLDEADFEFEGEPSSSSTPTVVRFESMDFMTLSAGTLYYYRIAVTPDYDKFYYGETKTFRTDSVTTWRGTSSTSFSVNENWDKDQPYQEVDAIIDAGLIYEPANTTGSRYCDDFIVKPNGKFSLTGGTIYVGGKLIIQSNASSTGQILQKGTISMSGNGPVIVQRYINAAKWHNISSPVVSTLGDSIWDKRNLWEYIESSSSWSEVRSGNITTAMKGYDIYNLNGKTYSFIGTGLYTGSKSILLTNTSGTGNGWNLVGNPYPSAIDWCYVGTLGWTKTNVDGTYYVFDGNNNRYASYHCSSGGVNGGTRYIPVTQGFWVYCNSTSGGTLGVGNNTKIISSQSFWKKTVDSLDVSLHLIVSNGTNPDELLINVTLPESNIGHDANDALKAFSKDTNLYEIYSVISDTFKACINSTGLLTQDMVIPISFKPGAYNGSFSLTISRLDNLPEGATIFLEDLKTSQIHNFYTNSTYNFTSETTDDRARFLLHLSPTITQKQNISNENTRVYNYKNIIYIDNINSSLTTGNVSVYDISGRTIAQMDINGNGLHSVVLNNKGIYIVKFINERQIITKKILLN